MTLSSYEKKNILKNIPIFELSYEKKIDKKVYSDLCFALPYGKKTMFWFTVYNGEYICLSIPMRGSKMEVNNTQIETCCFNRELCYGKGTLCLGVKLTKKSIVVLYDVFLYKNRNYSKNDNYNKKIEVLSRLFENDIKNELILTRQTTFYFPCFAKTYNELYEKTRNAPYDIYSCMFVNIKPKYKHYHEPFMVYLWSNIKAKEHPNNTMSFMIKPDQDGIFDMYDLYVYHQGDYIYYSKAHINTLKMSYALNKYFNPQCSMYVDNLDVAEESDDELCNVDDAIATKCSAVVECVFNNYLKLWEPVRIINNRGGKSNVKVVTLYEIRK